MTSSSGAEAVKANLAKMGKKVLLVEGKDDWHTFGHIVRIATGAFPAFEMGYCGSDSAVQDTLLGMTQASRSRQTVVGAVLDADRVLEEDSGRAGIEGRIRALRGALGAVYAIPEQFPAQGLVVAPTAEWDKDRFPVLGIWLMPDNERDGIFEDLLRTSMRPESEQYVATVVDKAKADQMASFRDVERSKAIVKTHIAWQDPNKKNLGEAVGRHFDNLSQACQPFMNWLERLFGEPVHS
jgi:hypothetical protein